MKLRADRGESSARSRSSRLGSVSSLGCVDASVALRSTADASRHPRLETEPSPRHALNSETHAKGEVRDLALGKGGGSRLAYKLSSNFCTSAKHEW